MQYWTIQNKLALETLSQRKTYYPDFSQSNYLKGIPALNNLYSVFLKAFNNINFIEPDDQSGKGLIFSFYAYVTKSMTSSDLIKFSITFINTALQSVTYGNTSLRVLITDCYKLNSIVSSSIH